MKKAFTILLCLLASVSVFAETIPKINGNYHDIIIVGAGISGLTCGYYLRDKDIAILEKKDKVGGRTLSGFYGSFTYAKGTEYLGKPDSTLSQLISELKLDIKEIPYPMDGYFDGKNFYYGKDIDRYLASGSSTATFSRFVKSLLEENEKYNEIPNTNYDKNTKSLDNMTARQWLVKKGIPDIYANKYNVASRGLFGATIDEISALSFIPEAAFDFDQKDINLDSEAGENEGTGAYTFTQGLTQLTDSMGFALKEKIHLGCNVIKVEKNGELYEVTYANKTGKESVMTAKKVVIAVPSPVALKIAQKVITQEKAAILRTIKYSSYATVALFSDVPIFDKAFDLAVPDGYFFTDVYDGTWVERHYAKKQNIKKYIACVYIAPKNCNDHVLDTMGDSEILQNVYRDLDKVLKSASEKVTGYDIERFPYAYPVMTTGAYARLLNLDKLNHGSLILTGDYMRYPTFEAAVESGQEAAERIVDND